MYEFAAFLFRKLSRLAQRSLQVIEVYRDTLVPASLVGLFSKLSGLLLSGYIGSLVDITPRLRFARLAIVSEKVLNVANYTLFLALFGPLRDVAQDAFHGRAGVGSVASVWAIILATVAFSSVTVLANTGLTVAIERDWVMTIGQGNEKRLTLLNTYMRRIDLCSKLMAPVRDSSCSDCVLTAAVGIASNGHGWLQLRYDGIAGHVRVESGLGILVDRGGVQAFSGTAREADSKQSERKG